MVTFDPEDIRPQQSPLGPSWIPIYSINADFGLDHFEMAMLNIIQHPNVNSTVIMRADILRDEDEAGVNTVAQSDIPELDLSAMPLMRDLQDMDSRNPPISSSYSRHRAIIRRIIPRNPLRDYVINQSCLIYKGEGSMLVVYVPHLKDSDECPYYLPPAKAVALLCEAGKLSVHYLLFDSDETHPSREEFVNGSADGRLIRIALHLLQTSHKHSNGVMNGYKKRVNHDVVVDKVAFQDRYIELKQKHAKQIVSDWVEQTDPKKHVFEDLAIAAFLIELWNQMYKSKEDFYFCDLGCGNGLLVHILTLEGYQGKGIDARARKSWKTYPEHVVSELHQQVIVPAPLLTSAESSEPDVSKTFKFPNQQTVSCADVLADPSINTVDLPKNAFIIGNHSDELTVWIPLLGYPFVVIPCCSHALSGARYRFPPKSPENKSTYASLVDHVVDVATQVGWKVEKEILRIPSTRNAAIIGRERIPNPQKSVHEIIQEDGGAEGWIERTMNLQGKSPRDH